MKTVKDIAIIAIATALCIGCLTGCATQQSNDKGADFSGASKVAELATLKCYYHNVAESETDASGILAGLLRTGYKKMWIEYDGYVTLGIDVNQLKIEQPDASNVVKVALPSAEIQDIYLDKDSISDPLSETGWLTDISAEERNTAISAAQDDMEEKARANTMMFNQANERAKKLIEGYIQNVGSATGVEYTIEWQ